MKTRRLIAACSATTLVAAAMVASSAVGASADAGPITNMRVLVLGDNTQPVTNAWTTRLASEGVTYTLVQPTDTLPALESDATHGLFDGVVIGDGTARPAADIAAIDAYESAFGVHQIDGYQFPQPTLGVTWNNTAGAMDGKTGTLTAAATAGAFGYLKGSVPFQVGSYGYEATVTDATDFTAYLTATDGAELAGVYQHPVSTSDPQSGVAELSINFSYNANQQQWLMLAPGLIDWVTQDEHLGLYRNYLGQDIDDVFIPDNSWSTTYHCVPAATDPPDYTCGNDAQGNPVDSTPADQPPDVIMSASDVDYVAAWEKANGFTLNMAFNGVGACTNNGTDPVSSAVCTGTTVGGSALPGVQNDDTFPANSAFVNELLKDKADFNWITHTWSHEFLGCNVWLAMPVSSITGGTSGTLAAGAYNYVVTAATAYGESEPSAPQPVTLAANGSATLTWSDAQNGGGPSLAALQKEFPNPAGAFWGYKVYREAPGGTTYGLVGQVAEDPSGTATYSFTDTGFVAGAAPSSADTFPTATDPGILCATPTSTVPTWDTAAAIEQEINLDIAFAQANALPNDDETAMVTGEHSGLENPNMPAAIAATGIKTFAADGSRQPQSYTIGAASDSPRYPNNIYYDASTWAEEVDQYDTIYKGTPEGSYNEDQILASESGIAMSHLLANDPHVTYAHQSDLIGNHADPTDTTSGYTILTLLSDILNQYNALYTQPVTQMNDVTAAQTLAENAAWSAAETAGTVAAYTQGGSEYITNNGTAPIAVPITAPGSDLVSGAPFGDLYGGTRSAWVTLAVGQTEQISPPAASISGTVTDAYSGTTLSGVCEYLYTTTGTPAGFGTCTNAQGQYSLTGMPAGTYDLAFSDPTGTHTTQWYNGQGTQAVATTITVAAGQAVTGINAIMAGINSIAGTVTDAFSGNTLSGVCEYLYTTSGSPAGFGTCANAQGQYVLAGMPAGSYDLAFYDPTGTHTTQWYNGQGTQSTATPITIADGQAITGANAVMAGINSISGTVTDAVSGSTLSGICVYLYTVSGPSAGYGTCTNAQGQYVLAGMPAGTYALAFADPTGTHTTQWYNGQGTQSTATTITIANGQAISGDNAVMQGITSISGTVTDAVTGNTLSGICVYLYTVSGPSAGYGTCTNAQGQYVLAGMPAGTYALAFADPTGTHNTQWFDGKPDQQDATPITIASGQAIAGDNAVMQGINSVSGTVTDSVTGDPLSGICVYLYTTAGTSAGFGTCTNAQGQYVLAGMGAGNYNLAFADPAGTYLTQWYSGQTSESTAGTVAIANGQALTDDNAAMVKVPA